MKPGQVQRAAQDAEALIQQYASNGESDPAPEQLGDPQPAEAELAVADPSPPQSNPQPESEPVAVAEPAPVAIPESLSAQPEPQAPASASNQPFEPAKATKGELLEAFLQLEQRHRSLQGTYQAQVPRKEQELRDTQTQVSTLEQRVTELMSQLEAAQAAPPASAEQPEVNLSSPFAQRMVEEWGEDSAREILAEMSTEQSRQQPAPADTPANPVSQDQPPAQPDAPVQAQPNQQGAGGEEELAKIVESLVGPGSFTAIDRDPEFKAWLDQPDMREGGKTRRAALHLAFKGGDLHRAAGFWSDWAQIKFQGTRLIPQPNDADLREAHLDTPATQSGPGLVDEPGVVRASEINTFYADVSKGRYVGRAEERAAMEQKINAAVQSNTVLQDVRQVSSA